MKTITAIGFLVGGVGLGLLAAYLTFGRATHFTGGDSGIGIRSSGDDEPIIMAGGSLNIFTHVHKFDSDSNMQLVHKDPRKFLAAADIYYGNVQIDSVKFAGKQAKIDIDYCPASGCVASSTDTVTFGTDSMGSSLQLSSSQRKMAMETTSTSNLVQHQPPDFKIQEIRINGAIYDCPVDIRCTVVLHHCSKNDCS
jgi:hypothetical protein